MESRQFAWLPVRVTSGKRIWLKYYLVHRELYDASTGRPSLNNLYFTWSETQQEKTWRLLKESAVHNRNIWNEYTYTIEDKL